MVLAFAAGAIPLQADLLLNQLPLVLVVAGLGLMGLEALAPGAHFVVLGVALLVAGMVGVALGALGLGGVILAAILAAVVVASGAGTLYAYRKFDFYGGKNMAQTTDSDSLRGKSGRVTERVTHSGGQVKLDGGGFNPYYAARALDGEIPEGEPVMVTDPGGGNVVTVESLSAIEGDIERELAQGREEEPDDEREHETA
ncbi:MULTISPECIES: NfeD family protein [Halococcus]|uniref:Uncharacterized protein n=1 Tax=Halococcus salifodinae DSM 8989 TaxID=1227456 RepID=M0NDM4_9EURY|nr:MULTISPECIES: NfeD family protein [Halococcus]EMA55658.1 hypothetical protein C450_01337 [Halococcus salifodinae DSM 8989]